jgi:hypothetical protein
VEGREGSGSSFFLAACAADEEQRKAQREEFAKAATEAEAQIAQQDDARYKSYGRPGSPAYIDCRTSLKNDRKRIPDLLRPDPPAPTGETPRPPMPIGTASPE